MKESTVQTTSRLAQWTIHNSSYAFSAKSDPFTIGSWTWLLSVEKSRVSRVKIYPQHSGHSCKEHPPIASFTLRCLTCLPRPKPLASSESKDRLLNYGEGFVWGFEVLPPPNFIIQVEFLHLKTASPNGGEPCSIWPNRFLQQKSDAAAIDCLARMLTEGIQTDIKIIINDSNRSLGAHRAVLAARSPVFCSMFSHNLRENDLSTIHISDMSLDVCLSFLKYLYGTIKEEEFMTHRLALLHAADKYDVYDLREACLESLLEDIDSSNVLERLQNASLYQLPKLKSGCLQYLVKFGKIFDIQDDFASFVQSAERDLILEVFHAILNDWTGA